jgi:cytochrome c peroxidase
MEYKFIEPLSTYYFSNEESLLNGPPVMSLYPDGMAASANQPEGFQVLEEILFEANTIDTLAAIRSIKGIERIVSDQASRFEGMQVYDVHVFDLVRQELIRINTLGISGFDSPILKNSIPEAWASYTGCYQVILPLVKHYRFKNPELADEIVRLFQSGLVYLNENTHFESFDRLSFTRNYSDLLYEKILQFQESTGIEKPYQISAVHRKVNYDATSLFSNDLLNPFSFSRFNNEIPDSAIITLGKLLFYDPVLSGNNLRACSSCHSPNKGFGDGRKKSLAFDKQGSVDRNAPTVINSALQNDFFWDMRSQNLNNQIDHVVASHKEFNTNYTEMVSKLRKSPEYRILFQQAFNSSDTSRSISVSGIKHALAAFIRSLTSVNSSFDQFMRRETVALSADVKAGYNLFMGKATCGTCHFAPTFFGTVPPHFNHNEGEVLGIPASAENMKMDGDLGRYSIYRFYNYEFLNGMFKIPTIRNVEITAPYMHNGVYNSLLEVVDFYDAGGGAGFGFHIPQQSLPSDSLHLTDIEKSQLLAFMNSLTDTSIDMTVPQSLPRFPGNDTLNNRVIGGLY